MKRSRRREYPHEVVYSSPHRNPTGAAIPGAAVTPTDIAISVVLTALTKAAGEYQFNALAPGTRDVGPFEKSFSTVTDRREIQFALKVYF